MIIRMFMVSILLLLAACGSNDNSSGTDSEGVTRITVGTLPAADVAPLYLGIEKGFFEDQDLEVKTELAAGGAEAIPAVLSGSQQFAESNVISLMIAEEQGLELELVAPAATGGDTETNDYGSIIVQGDSPIREVADLAGKTVASNTLNNIVSIAVQANLVAAGVDEKDIKIVEVGFPDMNAALANGEVDAIAQVEPFVTLAKEEGERVLTPLWFHIAPKLIVSGWFTSSEYLAENPDVVERFQTAMAESQAYAQENPDEVRRVFPDFSGVEPELAEQINLPIFESSVDLSSMDLLAEMMVRFGLTSSKPDVEELTRSAADGS